MNDLFEKEAVVLLQDLASAPRNNTTAKLNDLLVRAAHPRSDLNLPRAADVDAEDDRKG